MKLYSDRNKNKYPEYAEEFAEDFFEIEYNALRTEIAGGPITRRISEESEDMSVLENFPSF